MSSTRLLAAAGAAVLLATPAAHAADLPIAPCSGPAAASPACAAPVEFSGWYLRGYVGMTNQSVDTAGFKPNPFPNDIISTAFMNFDASPFAGGGIGYQVNNWLRFDVTAEYRAASQFKAIGAFTEFCPNGPAFCFDVNQGSHSAEVFLANAYIDLGTWWCLTPFIGAGVGGALNTVSNMTDFGFQNGFSALGFASTNATNANLAWAAHAGVAYNVSNNLKLEFAWRYLSLGSVKTPVVDCAFNGCIPTAGQPAAFYTLTNFNSQDFKIGLRWMLQPAEPVYAPPLIRKG
jgi:opacity protein-like surface antigen